MKKTLLLIFLLISIFLLSGFPVDASRGISVVSDLSHQSGKLGAYQALIIGINDYKDPRIPDLETAINDARAMAELLRKHYGFQVKLLLNRKATRKAIYKALRNLASSTKPDDSVLIYYAGHGDLDRTYDDGWWIPADAKGGDPVTYLDNVQVQKAMRSMKARHVLLISDSCYSGTLFGQARAMPPVIDNKYYLNLYNEKSRWGMTSGNKTPVSDAGTGGHSVFAYQLINTLSKSERPYISTQEIYTQIAPIVSNNSEQMPLCRPVRNTGDQGGEFIFIRSARITSKPSITYSFPKPPVVHQIKKPPFSEPPVSKGKGDIYIESSPSGAVVYLDKKKKGITPLELSNIRAGRHRIELKKGKIYSARLEINLEADDFVKRKVKLQHAKGKVKISSDPKGAKIFLDYLDTGKTTPDVLRIEAGEHELLLEKKTKKGLLVYEKKIMVEPDRKVTLSIKMRRSPEETKKLLMAAIEKAKKNKEQVARDAALAGRVFGPLNNSPMGYTKEELKPRIEKALSSMAAHYNNQIEAARRKYNQRAKHKEGMAAAKSELKKRIREIGSRTQHEQRMLSIKARQIVAVYAVWENELNKSLIEARKYLEDMASTDPLLEKTDVNEYWNSHWKKGGAFYKANMAALRKVVNKSKWEDIKNIVRNKVHTNFTDWWKTKKYSKERPG